METLQLDTDGDLVIGPTDYAVVSGTDKIRQDLTYALREEYGSDPFHPYWGSLLPGMLGNIIGTDTLSQVQSEVMRVLQNYIAVQTAMLQNNLVAFDQSQFSTADIIGSIDSVTVTQDPQDPTRALVAVAVTTADGATVSVDASTPA